MFYVSDGRRQPLQIGGNPIKKPAPLRNVQFPPPAGAAPYIVVTKACMR